MDENRRVLGVSGSLRQSSLNSLFLRAMQLTTPPTINFEIYTRLDTLPLFNPDNENQDIPTVHHWQSALANADLILLASPEYAQGVSGIMKNALDWIVGSGEFTDKLVAFPNISVRASMAQSQLADTLQLMGANMLAQCSPKASLIAPYVLPDANEYMLIEHPEIGPRLKALWDNIEKALS